MAGAPSGGAVLVVDGVDVPASSSAAVPATAAAWLEAWAPRGVYTATRTTGHHARLSRWDEHAKRLRGMLSALREHDPASFASLLDPEPFGAAPAAVADSIRAVLAAVPLAGASLAAFAPASPEDAVDDAPTVLRMIAALTA